jgi:hypothetical protein
MRVTDLPEELLLCVLVALGQNPASLLWRGRLKMTCRLLRHLPCALFPRNEHGQVFIDVGQLGYYRRHHRVSQLVRAYDILSRRVVVISLDPEIAHYIGTNYAHPLREKLGRTSATSRTLRYSPMDDRVVWSVNNAWMTCDAHRAAPQHLALKPVISKDTRLALNQPALPVDLGRLRRAWNDDATLYRALAHLDRQVKDLSISGVGNNIRVELPMFEASHLTSLALTRVSLSQRSVCHLATLTNLSFLDLSDSLHAPGIATIAALTALLYEWHTERDELHKLILDSNDMTTMSFGARSVDVDHLATLVSAFAEDDQLDRISTTSLADHHVFLSCNRLDRTAWNLAILERRTFCPLGVTIRYDAAPRPPPPPSRQQEASLVKAAASAPSFAHSYANTSRERDRHLWQWYDYTCRNCGCVWKKHSITISYRQTAVSECLRRKKPCDARPEHERMQAGELFITDRNVPGNNGNNLTPTAEDTAKYDAMDVIVGINPSHPGSYEYFRADPNKVGLKIPIPPPL